jgi:hypothetical protein
MLANVLHKAGCPAQGSFGFFPSFNPAHSFSNQCQPNEPSMILRGPCLRTGRMAKNKFIKEGA